MARKKKSKAADASHEQESSRAGRGRSPKKRGPDEMLSRKEFPIVAIGASAGGLAALKTFFSGVPEDSDLAYVVIVHLSPDHESHLAELVQPHARIPVQQVSQTVKLEPNRVYVIPPNANLDTIDTHLRLSALEKRRQERAPIDHFFRTLAKTHDGQAIGVILTGTGSDGTLGIREIRQAGGSCIVQDPAEAEYDGMPQSAIATGIVDLILPLREIPEAILRIVRTRPRVPHLTERDELEGDGRRLLQKVFAQLRARTGRDFSRYKRSTIIRRIERRMQLRHLIELDDYLTLLRSEPEEVRTLGDDLLITVTSFFRDPIIFETLKRAVLPELFQSKGADDEIRVWSVGCATGEEAYSLAMLLQEESLRRDSMPRIQVFASDLHHHSLHKAREGFYPGDIESDVSPERLKRFFLKENGGYRVRKELRELVVFAPHNLLGDPPFSRLDLISCRNLLIYIQREVQGDIVELFHYALKPEGFLVLGTSETVDAGGLFRTVDKKCSIFRKRNVPGPEPRLPVFPATHTRLPVDSERSRLPVAPLAYKDLHLRLVEQYAPPSALVGPDDKVVHLSEHVGRYLLTPGGEPTVNIFKLVRKELQLELRTALHAARNRKEEVDSKPVAVRFNGESGYVALKVRPSLEPSQEGFALVMFLERASKEGSLQPASATNSSNPAAAASADERVQEIDAELQQTRQRLQAIIEEYETSQEEMKASNEEMQSTNEELRSTMEELETSKEELQSMNEELQTVNQENRHKVEELAQLSSDLQNLLEATEIATLFLDRQLRILRFTPKVGELFNIRMTDRGRPLSDLTHRLGYDELHHDAERVLANLVPISREVEDQSGRWYLTRVMPYRSTDDRIEGVVITFVDITRGKRSEQELAAAKAYAENIVETLHEPLVVLDHEFKIKSSNAAFCTHFQVDAGEIIGSKVFDLSNSPWRIPALQEMLQNVLSASRQLSDFEVRVKVAGLGEQVMHLNARHLDQDRLILLGIRDITDQENAKRELRENEEQFRAFLSATSDVVYRMSPDWSEMRYLEGRKFIPDTREPSRTWLETYIPSEDQTLVTAKIQEAIESRDVFELEHRVIRIDGMLGWASSRAIPILNEQGDIREWLGAASDISGRKEAESSLRVSEERLRRMINIRGVGVLTLRDDGTFIDANDCLLEMTGYTRNEVQSGKFSWRSLTPVEWVEAGEQQMQSLLQTGTIGPYEREYLRKDGSRSWMLFAGASMGDGTIVKYCLEIGGHKRAEMKVREHEQRFRTLVEQVQDYAIFMLDADGRGTSWNVGVKRILGFEEVEFVGQDVSPAIFTPEDIEQGVPQEERLQASTCGVFRNERWMRRKDGTRFWVSGITTALRDEQGKLLGFMKVMRDNTDHKLLDDELRRLAEELSTANRRKDEFLAILAHEIRDPLAPIRTGLEALKKPALEPGRLEEVRSVMERQTEQLVRLIDDLLDVARITRGRLELRKGHVRLDQVVRNAVEASRPAIDAARLELSVSLPERPFWMDADPHRLAQVISNLLNNSAKYTPARGKVSLTAELQGNHVVIIVQDTGVGIPLDLQPYVFDMFTQGTNQRSNSGLGIGLTLVKSLVELHGGRVEVASEGADRGTTVTVQLPVGSERPLLERETAPTEEANLNGLRVLVVDDRKPAADMLDVVLTMSGCQVRVAYEGTAAVEAAAAFRPDVIVMDLKMPALSGYEVASRIRREPWGQEIVLIALTGWGQEEDRRRTQEAGFDHHLVKPPPIDTLKQLLADAKSRRADNPPTPPE